MKRNQIGYKYIVDQRRLQFWKLYMGLDHKPHFVYPQTQHEKKQRKHGETRQATDKD